MSEQQAYDLETVLLQLREMIDAARTMPMSASVLVNRDETLEILDDALRSLPDELRHARWLLKERDEYLAQLQQQRLEVVRLLVAHGRPFTSRTGR